MLVMLRALLQLCTLATCAVLLGCRAPHHEPVPDLRGQDETVLTPSRGVWTFRYSPTSLNVDLDHGHRLAVDAVGERGTTRANGASERRGSSLSAPRWLPSS